VITPNGDGFNDFFQIQATGIKELSGQIFDRREHLLFEWSGLDIKWDGYYEGKPVSDGTYFYNITATGYDKKEYHETGTITVIK
jgi:gliding motility-associated-like protein